MLRRCLKTFWGALVIGTLLTALLCISQTPPNLSLFSNDDRYEVELSPPGDGQDQCAPHTHIFFLKMHKCGSSTVQNIFLRYGFKNNLTFAFPKSGNYFGYPKLFTKEMIPKRLLPTDGKVDIFTIHTRLNVPELTKVLHNDTRWVTIVRDPASLYESLFTYYNMGRTYRLKLYQFNSVLMSELEALPRFKGIYGKNQMLFDFGYYDNLNVTQLLRAVNEVDDKFDLVMIAEYMDESLILLRHLLCWSIHDVIAFTKNARRQEVKSNLDLQTIKTLRELNSADALLYSHLLARHQRAVKEFGTRRMTDEVSALRKLRDEYYEDCGTYKLRGRDPSLQFKECSNLVNTYVTSNDSETCILLSMPELQLLDKTQKYQLTMLHAKMISEQS